ncbi:universal stress protein Slr1101 [Pocillopora verrucosa]|uniref:universal stress protein Slr1101 n=1 Tax=Pocillopora verrucosa TaxID=203993 RepID=UPI002797BD03|nr:universal stress protein Slr1101-like [Pocillopora verrucosa]
MAGSEENVRKIVLGVDGSEHCERALEWYVKNLSNKKTDKLFIIHAQEPPTIPAAPYPYGYAYYEEWQHLLQKSDKHAKELLESFGAKCNHHELKFKLYKEESNRPGEVICKLAKDEGADIILIGSRGVGTLRRTFLGSVSDYCVHHTHIPVVVIPPQDSHGDHAHAH